MDPSNETIINSSLVNLSRVLTRQDRKPLSQLIAKVVKYINLNTKYGVDQVLLQANPADEDDAIILITSQKKSEAIKLLILAEWEELLSKYDYTAPHSIQRKQGGLEFMLNDGLKLLFVPGWEGEKYADSGDRKYKPIAVEESDSDNNEFKELLAVQNVIVHQVIPLVTFWFENLYLGPLTIPCIDVNLDLISIYAGQNASSVVRAFLNIVEHIETIEEFDMGYGKIGGKWVVKKEEAREEDGVGFFRLDKELWCINQFVRDHTRNIFLEVEEVLNLKRFATLTKKKLAARLDAQGVQNKPLLLLMAVQPRELVPKKFTKVKLDQEVVEEECGTIVRNQEVKKHPGEKYIDFLRGRVIKMINLALARMMMGDNEGIQMTELMEHVEIMISQIVLREEDNVAKSEMDEEFDVTIRIPFQPCPQLGAMVVGFSWKE